MKIACLMMQKNEGALLKFWFDYHADVFGLENLFIFDNGSDDLITVNILKEIELRGGNVNYDYSSKNDFEIKGPIISSKIKSFSLKEYDFYFPLDCDEFIGVDCAEGEIKVDKGSIYDALAVHMDSKNVLMINYALDNSPILPNYYLLSPDQKKCFFAGDACLFLDNGFHEGITHDGTESIKTSIIYFHFHNRAFQRNVASAKEKLMGRVDINSEAELDELWINKAPGFHLVPYLKITREEYYANFLRGDLVFNNSFLRVLSTFGDPSVLFATDLTSGRDTLVMRSSVNFTFEELLYDNLGSVTIKGWCFDTLSCAPLFICLEEVSNEYYYVDRVNRPDVVAFHPDAPAESGFLLKINLLNLMVDRVSNYEGTITFKALRADGLFENVLFKKIFIKPNFF